MAWTVVGNRAEMQRFAPHSSQLSKINTGISGSRQHTDGGTGNILHQSEMLASLRYCGPAVDRIPRPGRLHQRNTHLWRLIGEPAWSLF
jgi:hypothetical protein